MNGKINSMKKTLALVLSLIFLSLASPIFTRSFHQVRPAFAQERLDLTASITTEGSGEWELWGLPVETPPPQFNMLGLSGYVAMESTAGAESSYVALISILNSPSGNCPSEPILFASNEERRELYPDTHSISNFIVKNIGDGRKEVPTEFTLPIKVPLEGCLFILVGGGNPAERKPITVESHMSLIYDTEPAPSPAPYFLRTSFEFCYGYHGCRADALEAKAENAFARVKKIDSPHYLWSLSGNVNASTFVPPWSSEPEDPWTMEFDYYLYKNCPPPPFEPSEFSGPADYYSQIPDDAENLLSLEFQGEGRGVFHQPVFKAFAPKLIEPGNCLVGLTRTVGNGAFSNESQVYTLVQPAQEETCEVYDPGEHPLGWVEECTSDDKTVCSQTSCVPYYPPYICIAAANTPYRASTSGNDQFVYCGTGGAWRDVDYRQERCSEVSLLEGWFSECRSDACFIESGEDSPHGDYSLLDIDNKDKECCGDDTDENYVCAGTFCKCCRQRHDYVDEMGSCRTKGDLDDDDDIDSQDLKILLQNWGDSPSVPAADLNEDSIVNGIDFGKLRKLIQ